MGTARPTANGFPKTLDVDKDQAKRKLDWNHLCGEIIDEEVPALLWQDNNSVLLLSTIHESTSYTLSKRKKPKLTSTNAAKARLPFAPTEHTKLLAIPTIINDYNQHMGGVDIADQLRSNYCVQQKSLRNWLPLFYWLLDTAIINSYRLHQQHYPTTTHKKFREDIIHSWIQSTILIGPTPISLPPSARYTTTQSIPHPLTFRLTGPHEDIWKPKADRRWCWLCRYKQKMSLPGTKTKPGHGKSTIPDFRTRIMCSKCEIYLCTGANCFQLYHSVAI